MNNNAAAPENSQSAAGPDRIIYREKHWVPWYYWPMAAAVVAITVAMVSLNRSVWWLVVSTIVVSGIALWVLLTWSNSVITVSEDSEGTRWLSVKGAQLPHDIVSRCLAVPASAKRSALGPQLDPAAFVVTHGWVPTMAMMVLDDPSDPTPYWLICSVDPEALLTAFLPDLPHT